MINKSNKPCKNKQNGNNDNRNRTIFHFINIIVAGIRYSVKYEIFKELAQSTIYYG